MDKKSYSFIQELMKEVLLYKNEAKKNKLIQPKTIPKNIAASPRPSKEEIINKHKSSYSKVNYEIIFAHAKSIL